MEETIIEAYNDAKACSKIKNMKEIVAKAKNTLFLNKYEIPINRKPIKPHIWLAHKILESEEKLSIILLIIFLSLHEK